MTDNFSKAKLSMSEINRFHGKHAITIWGRNTHKVYRFAGMLHTPQLSIFYMRPKCFIWHSDCIVTATTKKQMSIFASNYYYKALTRKLLLNL